jgi:hypothetical protein
MVMVVLPKLGAKAKDHPRGWNEKIDRVRPELLVEWGVQVYDAGKITWSRKRMIIRNPPTYRIFNPSIGLLKAKIQLGDTAHSLKGTKGFERLPYDGRRVPAGTRVPKIAAEIQKALKGKATGYAVGREFYHRGPHTLAELKAMLGEFQAAGLAT